MNRFFKILFFTLATLTFSLGKLEALPHKHQGKERISVSTMNFHDHGARWSFNAIGQWLSRDPLAELDLWNSAYSYCKNNPVNYRDPDGRMAVTDWVEDESGKIYWDENATSQETTKEREIYLGKEGFGINAETGGFMHYLPNGTTSQSMMSLPSVSITHTMTAHEQAMSNPLVQSIHRGQGEFWSTLDNFFDYLNHGLTNPQDRNPYTFTGTAPIPIRIKGVPGLSRALQTGKHTLKGSTLKTLRLTKEQGRNAIEALKRDMGIPHNVHGTIRSNGDYVLNGGVKGNLYDYLP